MLRRLTEEAPDVIEAVADVDRSLIYDTLACTRDARFDRAAFVERTREAMGRAARRPFRAHPRPASRRGDR
jgi:hypothetical protein